MFARLLILIALIAPTTTQSTTATTAPVTTQSPMPTPSTGPCSNGFASDTIFGFSAPANETDVTPVNVTLQIATNFTVNYPVTLEAFRFYEPTAVSNESRTFVLYDAVTGVPLLTTIAQITTPAPAWISVDVAATALTPGDYSVSVTVSPDQEFAYTAGTFADNMTVTSVPIGTLTATGSAFNDDPTTIPTEVDEADGPPAYYVDVVVNEQCCNSVADCTPATDLCTTVVCTNSTLR